METITLSHPITADGQEVTEITMRRPKVRDQIAAEKAQGTAAEQEVTLFANLCELAPKAIHELDMADYQKVQRTYSGFIGSPQGTADDSASS